MQYVENLQIWTWNQQFNDPTSGSGGSKTRFAQIALSHVRLIKRVLKFDPRLHCRKLRFKTIIKRHRVIKKALEFNRKEIISYKILNLDKLIIINRPRDLL